MDTSLAAKLEHFIRLKGTSANALAKDSGVPQPTIFKILTGKTKSPTLKTLQKISDALDIKINNLTGISDDISNLPLAGSQKINVYEDKDQPAADMVSIPEYNVSFACGKDAAEASFEEEHNSRPVWYHRSFFDNLGINPKNCRRFVVSGDSMAPLINDGDTVLIDCTPGQKLIDGEIYGFWQAQNGLRVKRIYIPMGGGITIHSDNPRYEDEYYDDSESCNFRLIGRVLERSGSVV